ncbi:MAG: hypothetical protein ACOYJ8_03670 [Patescibacteria group bacterium]|jgi:hypothetical protein
MSKERSAPSLWRLHQKNLNPCKKEGAFGELFQHQQKNNNRLQKEPSEIPLSDWLANLEKSRQ